ASRILRIASTAAVEVHNLTIEHGVANNANGGAIFNDGILTLVQSTVTGNSARGNNGNYPSYFRDEGAGGGIYNAPGALLNILESTISGNTAEGGGGGYSRRGAGGGGGAGLGGGIFNDGTLHLINSTVSGNAALGGAG